MRSIGRKDGVEWVEVVLSEQERLAGPRSGLPSVIDLGRKHGVDVKRFGSSPSGLAETVYWLQGPRLKEPA